MAALRTGVRVGTACAVLCAAAPARAGPHPANPATEAVADGGDARWETYRAESVSLGLEVRVDDGRAPVPPPRWEIEQVDFVPPIRIDEDLVLYQGGDRLDVPDFLDLVGEPARATELRLQVRRSRRWSGALFGFGAAGGLAAVGGIAGLERAGLDADTAAGPNAWVFGAGVTAMVIGLVGGSIPAARASRLRRRPLASLSMDEVTRLQTRYDTALRDSLGLE